MTVEIEGVNKTDILSSVERKEIENLYYPGMRLDEIIEGKREISNFPSQSWLRNDEIPVFISRAESYSEENSVPRSKVFDFSNHPEEMKSVLEKIELEGRDDREVVRLGERFGEMVYEVGESIDYSSICSLAVSDIDTVRLDEYRDLIEEREVNINKLGSPAWLQETVSEITDLPENIIKEDDWLYVDPESDKIAIPCDAGETLIYHFKELADEVLNDKIYFRTGFYDSTNII